MSRKDVLRVLEAAYAFDVDEQAWLEGIVRALQPYDLGGGVGAQIADMKRLTLRALVGAVPGIDVAHLAANLAEAPPEFFRSVNEPAPVTFITDALRKACARAGLTREALDRLGIPMARAAYGARGGDPEVESVTLVFPCRARGDLAMADRRVLDAIAAHLGAALRLRSVLRASPTADHPVAEAVLAPDGKVLAARGAPAKRARATLCEAVRSVGRARSRKATPEERLSLWRALVDGRWSIVESTERDGKLMVLACRNEPRTRRIRHLSARQRSVAQYAALGHSYKYIAYELGMSIPSVAAELHEALRKLGLKSRAELIRTFGA
jgi:DNA-binding NarL/FixJ family response regulator